MNNVPNPPVTTGSPSWMSLMTRERWLEVARIGMMATVIGFYQLHFVPLMVLLSAVVIGIYPLVRTGVLDLVRERKIGTELFITIATVIAIIGHEYLEVKK